MSQSSKCLKDFDFMVKKIEADYPGYFDKIANSNRAEFKTFEKHIRQRIENHSDSCLYLLNEYTGFFKDRHLVVNSIWKNNNIQYEIMPYSTYGKNVNINVDSLQQMAKVCKNVEGLWEGFWDTFAIVNDDDKYIGVAIKKDKWTFGQVLYEFQPINDTVFNVINFSLIKDARNHETKATLHLDGKILEFHNETRFVRKTDSEIFDKATLYSYVPQFPNGTNTYPLATFLGDSTFYIRVPEFYSNTANDLVKKHWEVIVRCPNLIIDIRNNGGGQDINYQEFLKIIYTKPYESKGVEWYASSGNIKDFENAIKSGEIRNGEEGLRWTKTLVDAMKKNKGGYVVHPDYATYNDMVVRDTVYPLPRNVGIIINKGNASSAEQFILAAKESDKVILFGNSNTAGVLDYSNITPTPLPSNSYQLWCPMTRSMRLPEKPIDNIGISPDVIIPFPEKVQLFDKLDDWAYFVKNYLELIDK